MASASFPLPLTDAGWPPWRLGGRWGHFNRISSLILNSNQRASFNLFLLVAGKGWGQKQSQFLMLMMESVTVKSPDGQRIWHSGSLKEGQPPSAEPPGPEPVALLAGHCGLSYNPPLTSDPAGLPGGKESLLFKEIFFFCLHFPRQRLCKKKP